jgi:hypothetical protein
MLHTTRQRHIGLAGVLIIFVMLVISFPTLAGASANDMVKDQLLNLAQRKINGEYNALITGNTSELTKTTPEISGLAAERKSSVAVLQLRRHNMLADHGQRYTKSASKLFIEKAEINTTNATITANEDVTLTLVDQHSSEPVFTKEMKNHVLHFTQQGGKWKLVEDDVLDGFVPVIPDVDEERITKQPLSLDTTIKMLKQKTSSTDGTAVAAVTAGTFNRAAAVNYARSYWNNYNTGYRTYSNDCTNFTSQALNWAGWQHIGGWFDDAHYWWYSPSAVLSWGGRAEARSWVNVHSFYYFARYANRVTDAQYLAQFDLGDNFHFDFSPPDGILDHNAIVTKNNGGGNIFLTYHSVNTLDISIWDVIARTPGANYYGSLMKTSY